MSRLARIWDGGTYTTHSISGLGPQRRLRDCNIEDVGAHFQRRPSEAMEFDPYGVNKAEARGLVLELFGPERYPEPIKVLSMPGNGWHFEVALLQIREMKRKFNKGRGPARTEIHGVENDRGVYYENLMLVPGISHPQNVIVDLGRTPYAERALSYYWVKRYLFANVDDVLATDDVYDCVWLDYFGPLTLERLALIQRFYERQVRGSLVLTSLHGRWNPHVSSALSAFASYEDWLRAAFAGAHVEHYLEYFDTSPMVQFAISKEGR